ncbi:MAG TPA: hypothetical protein VN761_04990 [Candidatus Polarisedimenticolia bacterium]|nr:hypothetical protein [Candidatus Polarisedimenticolia bacterium]
MNLLSRFWTPKKERQLEGGSWKAESGREKIRRKNPQKSAKYVGDWRASFLLLPMMALLPFRFIIASSPFAFVFTTTRERCNENSAGKKRSVYLAFSAVPSGLGLLLH